MVESRIILDIYCSETAEYMRSKLSGIVYCGNNSQGELVIGPKFQRRFKSWKTHQLEFFAIEEGLKACKEFLQDKSESATIVVHSDNLDVIQYLNGDRPEFRDSMRGALGNVEEIATQFLKVIYTYEEHSTEMMQRMHNFVRSSLRRPSIL